MNWKIYSIVQIPVETYKIIDHKQYSQCRNFGRSLSAAIVVSSISYFLTNSMKQALQQLASPSKSYQSVDAAKLSGLIREVVMKNNQEQFWDYMVTNDPLCEKGKQLYQEFCKIQFPNNREENLHQCFANLFNLEINFINQYSIGKGSHKIYILLKNQHYFYLIPKNIFNSVQSSNKKYLCYICKEQHSQYYDPQCHHIQCANCLKKSFGIQLDQIECKSNPYCRCKIYRKEVEMKGIKLEQLEQRSYPPQTQQQSQMSNQLAQSTLPQKPVNRQPIQQEYDSCSNCKSISQTETLECKHQLCSTCLKMAKVQQKQCIIRDCILNNTKLTDQNSQLLQKQQSSSFKQCSICLKHQLVSEQFTNSCIHSICKKCQPQIIANNFVFKCKARFCSQPIDKAMFQQYLNHEKAPFSCCKCKESYFWEDLYFNKQCFHAICFTCTQKILDRQQRPQFLCPDAECRYYFQGEEFEQFYEQFQMKLIQQSIKFDQEEQDQKKSLISLEEEKVNRGSRFQLSNQSQLQQSLYEQQSAQIQQQNKNGQFENNRIKITNQSQNENSQNGSKKIIKSVIDQITKELSSGECTMCNSPFSEYNLRQEVDCNIHKIGVCCIKASLKCQQCETKKINTSAIRPKSKLIFQSLVIPNNNDMIQSYNKFTSGNEDKKYGYQDDYAAENVRQNSRINNNQSQIKEQQQIRNNTTDNALFKSLQQPKATSKFGFFGK